MHPEWQQRLVPKLRDLFPGLQVLATTHSPLVVLNMKPGELVKLSREEGEPPPEVESSDDNWPVHAEFVVDPLKGLNAAQALSRLFSLDSPSDLETANDYLRYSQLSSSADRSEADEEEMDRLAAKLRLNSTRDATVEAAEARSMIGAMFAERLKAMRSGEQQKLLDEVTIQLLELSSSPPRPDIPEAEAALRTSE